MARYMVDSTSPADALAQPADMYAGYTDGRYVNVGALRAGTDKPVVEISAIGTNSGIVGDCEPGCIWPQSEIVDWVLMRRRSGVEPTVYVGAANLASVVAAFDQRGVTRPVVFWTAHYTNTPHYCGEGCSYGRGLGVNVVATQYGGDLIGHYDANTVKDYWPGVDSAEHPAGSGTILGPLQPTTQPDRDEDDMQLIQGPTRGIALVGPGYFRQLIDDEEVALAGEMYGAPKFKDDRKFDVAAGLALGGRPDDTQVAAIQREDGRG